jgi:hypothetical protein
MERGIVRGIIFTGLTLLVLIVLGASVVVAEERPESVVMRTYRWVLIPRKGHYEELLGAPYRVALKAHRADFTPDAYAALWKIEQTKIDFDRGLRESFWPQSPFSTYDDCGEFFLPRVVGTDISGDNAIVSVELPGTLYGPRGSGVNIFSIKVDLERINSRWLIANTRNQQFRFNLIESLRRYK